MPAISRFSSTPVTINRDGTRWIGQWYPPALADVSEQVYTVTSADIDRPWLISFAAYGVPDYWWLILWYNGINDPFSLNVGDKLLIPSTTFQATSQPSDITPEVLPPPQPVEVQYPKPYSSPYATAQVSSNTSQSANPNYIFNFQINVWDAALTGLVGFQIRVASDPAFQNIVLASLTAVDPTRWFFYDLGANGGTGGFVPFPAGGIDPMANAGQPVYFQFLSGDPIQPGTQYYIQYRQWQPSAESAWQTVAPFAIIPG